MTATTRTAATTAPGSGRRRRANRASGRKGSWVHTAIGLAIVGLMLFPVYWMINVSLQPTGSAVGTPWIPLNVSFDGYATAIADQGGPLMISLMIATGSVVLSLFIAAPAAYALSRFRIPGTQYFLLAVLISQMIPGIVVANALYSAYNDLGLLNSFLGLILADSTVGIPFAMLILRAFMGSIHPSVVEAAAVDGAGQLRTFFSIVLPMSRNALVTAGLFSFLFAWGDFLFALTLTTTTDMRPITLALYTYIGSYVADWSAVMATAVLASIPAIVLLVVAQQFVAAGTTAGAVK